jgi:hypothetical protein
MRLGGRWAAFWLVAISVTASFASSIRSQAGLPLLLAALVGVAWLRAGWKRRIAVGVLVALAYVSISPVAIGTLRAYRDTWAGRDLGAGLPTAHPFWHPTYLGLGYLPNPYGIQWDDSVAAAAVERDDPGAPYLSERYENSLKRQFFTILQRDPGFVGRTYLAKLRVIVSDAFGAWWTLLGVVAALVLLTGARIRAAQPQIVLLLPAILVNAIPPVLTIPSREYEVGWLAAWGLAWQLSLCWMVVGLTARLASNRLTPAVALRRLTSLRVQPTSQWFGRRTLAIFLGMSVVVMAGVCVYTVNGDADAASTYQNGHAKLVSRASLLPRTIRTWSFSSGLDTDWQPVGAVNVEPTARGLLVRTTTQKYAYQLWTVPERLPIGDYQFSVEGRPTLGGLYLGALDVDRNTWLSTSNYWSKQDGYDEGLMVTFFKVATPVDVRFVISNWNPKGESSTWLLLRASVLSPYAQ